MQPMRPCNQCPPPDLPRRIHRGTRAAASRLSPVTPQRASWTSPHAHQVQGLIFASAHSWCRRGERQRMTRIRCGRPTRRSRNRTSSTMWRQRLRAHHGQRRTAADCLKADKASRTLVPRWVENRHSLKRHKSSAVGGATRDAIAETDLQQPFVKSPKTSSSSTPPQKIPDATRQREWLRRKPKRRSG
jgi:hypothetical protein